MSRSKRGGKTPQISYWGRRLGNPHWPNSPCTSGHEGSTRQKRNTTHRERRRDEAALRQELDSLP